MTNKSFCVFIISHGRPDNVITLRTLKRCNYTGPLFIVCDNEDSTVPQYKANHGAGMVLVFDKPKYAAMVDSCDNFQNRRTTTHARNACFDLAEQRGFEYFLVLDDDYTRFSLVKENDVTTNDHPARGIDAQIEATFCFLDSDERVKSICWMQTGDTIGGMPNWVKWNTIFPFSKRKAMNSFFCKTSRRFWFFSRLNEDVNTYLALGARGDIFMTIPQVLLQQKLTQKSSGGMSDAYAASGTYVKSFYTVMITPSSARVAITPAMNRLHHKISWNNAVPKILDEAHKR